MILVIFIILDIIGIIVGAVLPEKADDFDMGVFSLAYLCSLFLLLLVVEIMS